MGIKDLDRLNKLAQYANSFEPYHFDMDTDTKYSRNLILISQYGITIRQPISEYTAKVSKSIGFKPFVPDLLDYNHKLIIEYNEEPLPQRGAKIIKKGHDEFSDHDKDLYYKLAGFKQLKIWESDQLWMDKIDSFLSGTTSL